MILDPLLDLFRGKAVTIPPLDGAFRPNTRLDDAPAAVTLGDADNLVRLPDGLAASSGNTLYRIEAGRPPRKWRSFGASVTAVAVSPSGDLAVATETGALHISDREEAVATERRCITALAYAADGTLWLANGASDHAPSQWSQDLMRHGSSGSVWRRAPGGAAFECVAGGLAFPYGLLPAEDSIVVSESWRHRLLRINPSATPVEIIGKLPGYPARLTPASDGGAWLCLFAPRNRLIEFVLQERDYRFDMLEQVAPPYWIAPALFSGRSFLEPLQCGGIKTMGVHKPWSPSRSYGLAVRLDAAMQPLHSLHSRASGARHGICSVLEHRGRLLVASRGGDCILDIDLAAQAEEAE